ncbi:permease [Robertmurraya sp.]|uniref:permease n=1 Tax=Robertmurraya sp. TaxID=2837525 RepID=UPI0037042128
MIHWIRLTAIEITGAVLLGCILFLVFTGGDFMKVLDGANFSIPSSLLSLNTIFLSILIEAIPFVLIGVLISGMIQVFVTEDHIRQWIPKNRFMAVLMSCVIGGLFPACECGIVPIVRRLVSKGVPVFAGVGFLLTGPIINPIVIISTYMAFGNDAKIAGLRMILGFVVAMIVALIISITFRGSQLKQGNMMIPIALTNASKPPVSKRIRQMLEHSIDEFFDMGKYLILGAFFAAFVQTYVSMKSIVDIGDGVASSSLVMMGIAYLLSLCSEADAFIAASFRNLFPVTSLLAFLVYGPMLDLKNTIMMLGVFRIRFVLVLIFLITVVVFGSVMVVHTWI